MDKNNIIGLALIFVLFFIWTRINAPTEAEIAERERIADSLRNVQAVADSLALLPAQPAVNTPTDLPVTTLTNDTMQLLRDQATYGPFASSVRGDESSEVLENELFKIQFSNKGGKIDFVELKNYHKVKLDSNLNEVQYPLQLLEDEGNRFEYLLPVANVPGGAVSTADLFFTAEKSGDAIIFRANAGNGRYIEQRYAIKENSYNIDYNLSLVGMDQVLDRKENFIQLNWINYLDQLENNTQYERNYSTIFYKPVEDDPDYCSCTSDDTEDVDQKRVKWVSHTNQFFNTSLIAQNPFQKAWLDIEMYEEGADNLKKLHTKLDLPLSGSGNEVFAMNMYAGPNEFKLLKTYDAELEDIIPYGWSFFGTINRWVIRPLFDFLSRFIGNKGLVILALTVIVKILLYPLTYKMLYSQSKMGAMKPRLAGLKEKHGDDQQKVQLETMKLYREFGVSPLGGCLPMVVQLPIWFALYRFFPASIEFRQADFLWATDLSSYDVFMRLPFEIPFYGAHVSMFTLLWAITTVIYTYYNTKHMDMTVNPMMKYMQYMMPVMFLFFFNNFAAGLTCYLLFSNIFNIGQTIITKNYVIDQEKIKAELEAYRKKPKKKGGFQERLESALREQQKAQQETKGKKKKK